MSQLQYELTEVRSKISQYQSEINELKSKNSQYENSSNENARYINELEAALKPLQPKRPNIMQQSDTQNWRVREQELLDRIEYLETQQPAEHNKSSDRSAIQFYEERIARLQSELDKTHLQSKGQLERDSRYQQEIEELKMFIIEKVEGPGQHLRQKQLEFQRELERIQIEHGQT
jgi:chromosome segregation ATPase